jgi:hypothetical protein
MNEILPWVNLVVVPVFIYIIKIERRLVRVETILKLIINGGGEK